MPTYVVSEMFFVIDVKIQKHTIPFGPNVVLTKSAIAMAPIKAACKKIILNKADTYKNSKM
jgi:hypothetical protein